MNIKFVCDKCKQEFDKDELSKKTVWDRSGDYFYKIEYLCEICVQESKS